MGAGQSQLKEELAAVKQQLEDANGKNKVLSTSNDDLKSQVTASTEAVAQARQEMTAVEQSCQAQLSGKDSALMKAVKEKELAEELRRSDSLLAKRIMTAQMRRAGEKELDAYSGGVEGSTMAAQLALAAQDEMQLRQMLIHTAEQLESTKALADGLQETAKGQRRREVAKALWGEELGDLSVSLRSSQFQVLCGMRLPRAGGGPSPALGGPNKPSGLSPAIAVLRQMGDTAGVPTAVGGSLLWDLKEQGVAALRVAVSTSPTPSQELALSFDANTQSGGLTGSIQSKHEGLTMRLFGTVDLSGNKANNRAGAKLVYDLD